MQKIYITLALENIKLTSTKCVFHEEKKLKYLNYYYCI